MTGLAAAIDTCACETDFSGVVAVTRDGEREHAGAFGFAERTTRTPNTLATRFAIASGTKSFTALAVMQLVERGTISPTMTARSLLGSDLALVDDRVTVEHLLAHRSGIGDYFDESVTDVDGFVLPVPPGSLDRQEAWLPVLDGHPTVTAPGETFAYNNGGYVLLALLAERASGIPFASLVEERVCAPAGLTGTTFHRGDVEVAGLAVGYLDDGRTNVSLMPRLGGGDGGLSSTLADVDRFWDALFGGRIVTPATVAEMVEPRSGPGDHAARYGLGFWLAASGPTVILEGCDAGISFRSAHDPTRALTSTVMSNTTDGAWPIARLLAELTA
ncbi:MAG: serine hydrolase domain-containing protein [Acidimicrobiia bacterium]